MSGWMLQYTRTRPGFVNRTRARGAVAVEAEVELAAGGAAEDVVEHLVHVRERHQRALRDGDDVRREALLGGRHGRRGSRASGRQTADPHHAAASPASSRHRGPPARPCRRAQRVAGASGAWAPAGAPAASRRPGPPRRAESSRRLATFRNRPLGHRRMVARWDLLRKLLFGRELWPAGLRVQYGSGAPAGFASSLFSRPRHLIVREVLANGLTLLTESMPHVRSVAIGVWLKRGSRHEGDGSPGISHFIEHMVFKGTKHRSAELIAAAGGLDRRPHGRVHGQGVRVLPPEGARRAPAAGRGHPGRHRAQPALRSRSR